MTGDFGYRRFIIPILLSKYKLCRSRYVSKQVGFLLAGDNHLGCEIEQGLQYKRAIKYEIPIKKLSDL